MTGSREAKVDINGRRNLKNGTLEGKAGGYETSKLEKKKKKKKKKERQELPTKGEKGAA